MKTKSLTRAFLLAIAILYVWLPNSEAVEHLSPPATYDNFGGGQYIWGQTFVAEQHFISGIQIYVGDPTRPNDPTVGELVGPATLNLYNSNHQLIASSVAVSTNEVIEGLATLRFSTAVPIEIGRDYMFGITAHDLFGVGLRSLATSTYAGGAEARIESSTGIFSALPNGRDLSFRTIEGKVAPTKIFLAWGVDVPVRIKPATLFGIDYYAKTQGTMPARIPDATFRKDLTTRIQKIFSASGIYNISFVSSRSSDSTNVYFTDPIDAKLQGRAYTGIDRCNYRKSDSIAIFLFPETPVEPEPVNCPGPYKLEKVAETVAHELGHSLGLSHLQSGGHEIMDYNFDYCQDDAFLDVPSPLVTYDAYNNPQFLTDTQNPNYHLKRYVEGIPHSVLVQQGTFPGTVDNISPPVCLLLKINFSQSDLVLYDVTILGGIGGTDLLPTLGYFDSVSLESLEALGFDLPSGSSIRLYASSSPGAPADIVLAVGDPSDLGNADVPVSPGSLQAVLYQQTATPGQFAALETAAVNVQAAPHVPPSLGIERTSFGVRTSWDAAAAGYTLQTSIDLVGWSDIVGPLSDPGIHDDVGTSLGTRFYRLRKP